MMKEYNWEAENRFMDAANQWGGSCHTVEGYWEDEDHLDGRE